MSKIITKDNLNPGSNFKGLQQRAERIQAAVEGAHTLANKQAEYIRALEIMLVAVADPTKIRPGDEDFLNKLTVKHYPEFKNVPTDS